MKKYFLILSLILSFSSLVVGQVFTPQTASGYQNKRTKTDSTNYIPTFCGLPNLRSITPQKQGAIAFDSCNHRFYFYDPKILAWDTVRAGGAGGSFYDSVLMASVKRLRDTAAAIRADIPKGGTTLFYDSTSLSTDSLKYIYYSGVTPVDSVRITSATNLATTNLIQSANRTYNGNGKTLQFSNFNFLQLQGGTGNAGLLRLDVAAASLNHNGSVIINSPSIYFPDLSQNNTFTRLLVRDNSFSGKLYWRDANSIIAAESDPIWTAASGNYRTFAQNNLLYAGISHTHPTSDITSGIFPIVRGGTGLNTIGTVGQSIRVATGGTALEYYTPSGGGAMKAQIPLVVNHDTISRRWNVLDYGADNSGVTDATLSIQAAINACDAAGGGEVFFPNGSYLIGGALGVNNSQLFIPGSLPTSALRNHIALLGEGKPNFTPVGFGLSGAAALPIARSPVILKSTLTTAAASGAAVIGTTLVGGGYNYTYLSVENIAIEVKNNPSGTGPVVGGINYKYGASLQCKNVAVYIDTSGFRSTAPQNDVTGIETSNINSETYNMLENTLVCGMRNGYIIGEHVVINQAQAMTCLRGFNIKAGYHSSTSLRAGMFWCAYDIYVSGFCTLSNFQFDTEFQQIGKWYDDIATVKDTANLASGQIFYTIIQASVGKNNALFSKIGGANLHALNNDEGIISHIGINDPIVSGTAGSALYLGASGILAQDNANYFWNSTNKQLGIGTNSTSHKLEINTGSSYDGIAITNSSSTTGSRIRLVNDAGAGGHLTIYGSAGPIPNFLGLGSDNGLAFYAGSSSPITFNNSVERMRLFSGGGLGINTTTDVPSAKLFVNGAISAGSIFNSETGNNLLTIQGNNSASGNTSTNPNIKFNVGNLGGATAMTILNNSKVGIGTTAPDDLLSIEGNSGSPAQVGMSVKNTNASGDTRFGLTNSAGGGLGLQVTGGSYGLPNICTFYSQGTVNNMGFITNGDVASGGSGDIYFSTGGYGSGQERMRISSTGAVRMHTYGAGTATFDASGNITSVSDERLKNIQGFYKSGLKELMKINPIVYKWNKKSGLEMNNTYAGFSAQNVKANIPYGTGENKAGYLSLQDRAILATLVNAVKEQQKEIELLKTEIKAMKEK